MATLLKQKTKTENTKKRGKEQQITNKKIIGFQKIKSWIIRTIKQ